MIVALLVFLTAAMAIVTHGNLVGATAPTLMALLLWVVWKLPVRTSLLALIFFGLTLESPQEIPAADLWHSPLYRLGAALLSKANDWTGIKPLVFTGVDLIVGYLTLVLIWRRATGSRIDTAGRVQTAPILALAAGISLVSTFWIWGYGLARGGDFGGSLLQVYKLLYVPILFYVCQAAFRGPVDHAALARTIVGAAMYRSALAIYVRNIVVLPHGQALPYATTHGDSMLFASATALIVAMFNERVGARVRGGIPALCACLCLIVGGMIANNRRVVWVEIAIILLVFYLTTGWTPLKRSVTRIAAVSLPLIALYAAVGWDSRYGLLFAPVRTVRSVLDSHSDSSTFWRDLENANLIADIQEHPILGKGLGHGYEERIKLPDISGFKVYRLFPHNSVLGFLAFAGVLGFTLMWCLLTVGVFLAARSYHRSAVPLDRAVALWVIATLISYITSVYADMGQVAWTGVFVVCPALGLVGKLAVASGAWPARVRAKPPALVADRAGRPG
jgi:O-antigen ligase